MLKRELYFCVLFFLSVSAMVEKVDLARRPRFDDPLSLKQRFFCTMMTATEQPEPEPETTEQATGARTTTTQADHRP